LIAVRVKLNRIKIGERRTHELAGENIQDESLISGTHYDLSFMRQESGALDSADIRELAQTLAGIDIEYGYSVIPGNQDLFPIGGELERADIISGEGIQRCGSLALD